jgi:hypothetical protein
MRSYFSNKNNYDLKTIILLNLYFYIKNILKNNRI